MPQQNDAFPTLWEARIGKYLTIKIQQGHKGADDVILYVANGKKALWQAVDKKEFQDAWNSTRRTPIDLHEDRITNDRQLRYAIQHELYKIINRTSDGYQKELYHDLPNVLITIADTEQYVKVPVRTRKQQK
jgi:hypothetical protein